MVEIEVQKARQGDCIWLRCVAEKSVNVVIDAGPSTFAAGFKNLIDKITGNKERIDLLVFSHIDDDHIRGCIRYLQDEDEKIIRFLYKGIIIKHNKTEPTYTKTSLFLCEKRRFFMARTEKGVVTTI